MRKRCNLKKKQQTKGWGRSASSERTYRVSCYGVFQRTVRATSVSDAADIAFREFIGEIDDGAREATDFAMCTGVFDYTSKTGYMMLTEHVLRRIGRLSE